MPATTFTKFGPCLLSVSLLLASCAPQIYEGQPVFDDSSDVFRDPAGMFYQVAWVNHNDLVFLYASSKDVSLSSFELYLYSLQTKHWAKLNSGPSQGCWSNERRWLQRLDVDLVGFFQRCNLHVDGKDSGGVDQLRSYSLATGAVKIIVEYDRKFHAANYSISPVDDHILQLDTRDQAFYVTGQDRTRILTDFVRVSTVCWSPVGDQFAFFAAGVADPKKQGDIFPKLPTDSPYDLYLANSLDSAAVRLVEGVRYGLYLKWSPQGDRLAFRGEIAGQSGIWVYELESRKLYRVWDHRAFFDWSPDGEQMIVIAPDEDGKSVPLLVEARE